MIFINRTPVTIEHFPDGTPKITINPMSIHRTTRIQWLYDSDDELFQLLCIVDKIRIMGFVEKLELQMPYIPNARFDRVTDESECFTLKTFAAVINSMKFDKVRVFDPHSNVSMALINNIVADEPSKLVSQAINQIYFDDRTTIEKKMILFFPDEGASKRYKHLSKYFHLPYLVGMKDRDWKTGKINGVKVLGTEQYPDIMKNPQDYKILIIDDICSRGGTFIGAAEGLKAIGFTDIYLYVSHCEHTILEGHIVETDDIKHVFTSDSIFREEHEKITVLPYMHLEEQFMPFD